MGLMRPLLALIAGALLLAACSNGTQVAADAGDLDRWCELAREFDDDAPLDLEGIEDEEEIAAAIRAYFGRTEFRERMNEFERVAPPDIRVVTEAVAIATRMAAVGDFTGMNSPGGRQAQAQVAAYRTEHCGEPAAGS